MKAQTIPIIKILNQNDRFTIAIQFHKDQNLLQIEMQVDSKLPKLYCKVYHPQTLPSQISLISQDLSFLFGCFQLDYNVLEENGQIILKPSINVNGQTIKKEIKIDLEEATMDSASNILGEAQEKGDSVKYTLSTTNTKQEQTISNIGAQSQQYLKQEEDQMKMLSGIHEYNIENIKGMTSQAKQFSNLLKRFDKENSMIYWDIEKTLNKNQKVLQQLTQRMNRQKKFGHKKPSKLKQVKQSSQESNQSQSLSPKPRDGKKYTDKLVVFKKPHLEQYFKIDQNQITFIKYSILYNQIIIKYHIRYVYQTCSYKVKIVKSFMNNISIGVVDQGNGRRSHTKAATVYNGKTATMKNRKFMKTQGNGFKSGDIIEVKLYHGEIKWFVNDKLEVAYKSNKLALQYLTFFPFIEMEDVGDQIQWICN